MIGIIDPTWQVSDLDPVTWRNLGRFFNPQQYIRAAQPDEHGLFVLHDDGHVLKVVDTAGLGRPEGIPDRIDAPEALARNLYGRGQWQRVHIIDRRHLAQVARQAQATPRRDLTLDAYYHLVYTLVLGDPRGYACELVRRIPATGMDGPMPRFAVSSRDCHPRQRSRSASMRAMRSRLASSFSVRGDSSVA